MPRSFSETMLGQLMSETSNIVSCWLLEITHVQLDTPIRLCNNDEDVVHDGDEYRAVAFEFTIPDEKAGAVNTSTLRIDNTDQYLTPYIRTLTGEFSLVARLVLATDEAATPPEFDLVEMETMALRIVELQYDADSIQAKVAVVSRLANFPGDTYNPIDFRALY